MTESESVALPLGYTPTNSNIIIAFFGFVNDFFQELLFLSALQGLAFVCEKYKLFLYPYLTDTGRSRLIIQIHKLIR